MKKKDKNLFSRREFLITSLISTASVFITACEQALDKTVDHGTSSVLFPSSTTTVSPTQTDTPTQTATSNQTVCPTESVTPITDCGNIGALPLDDSLDRSEVERAETREPNEIDYAIIHHSQNRGADGECVLLEHARDYEKQHSERDNDPKNGVVDAKYTEKELGYKWILYHYLISRDGFVLQVQNTNYVRVHANNNDINSRSIAICIDGDFRSVEQRGLGECPTEKQLELAAKIIRDWNCEHSIELIIRSHHEVAFPDENDVITDCPGANMGSRDDRDSNLSYLINLVYSKQCIDNWVEQRLGVGE